MRALRISAILLLLLDLALPLCAQEAAPGLAEFEAGRRAYDADRMAQARDTLLTLAQDAPDQFQAQFDAAECLRITGSELRARRQTQPLSGKEIKALKVEQETWSAQGLVFAERALALAGTDAEKAATHRVYAELYANSITGMVSGLKNGPKARTHMDEALARTPEDPECQRAIGIMYLNNPPFNGGDVDRAIETFSACHAQVPDSDTYLVLLAMSYQKRKDWDLALESVDAALQVNPANPNAAALRDAILAKKELAE